MMDDGITSSDLIKVINSSIDMQDGSQSATVQPVEGVPGCNSTNVGAQVK